MATIQIKEKSEIKQDFIDNIKIRVLEYKAVNITDYNIGGVLNTVVESFSDVLEKFYFDLFKVTKESLENIYNGLNFYKIPGKKSVCIVYIYFNTNDLATAQNLLYLNIPKGTKLSNEDGTIEFEIIDEYQPLNLQLAGGGSEFPGKVYYTATALSLTTGSLNNIQPNILTKLTTSITNLYSYSYSVRNASSSGGSEEETEENMKSRFQQYLVSLRRGTSEALGFALETNANFTGFLYSINKYTPLYIALQTQRNFNQTDFSLNSNTYDIDLTNNNKFDPQYSLCDQSDADQNGFFALYFGAPDTFLNLLFATSSVTANAFKIHRVQYFDSVLNLWNDVDETLLNVVLDSYATGDQYIYWNFADITRWGKISLLSYYGFFIRIIVQLDVDPIITPAAIEVFKCMTYPFPGYVDLYCLKNYRDNINQNDQIIVSEAVENYKAAGVITTVQNADVIQMYPTIIIYTSNLALSYVPSTVLQDIRNDIVSYANQLNINQDFDRHSFYSYIYDRYNQYGSIFIFYKYDNVLNEEPAYNIYKEQFRNAIFETSVREKADLNISDVFVVTNLNALLNTTVGIDYNDFDIIYHNNIAY